MNLTFKLLLFHVTVLLVLLIDFHLAFADLSADYYDIKCPQVETISRLVFRHTLHREIRFAASVLHFCAGLERINIMDDESEKTALPNRNYTRGSKVIDTDTVSRSRLIYAHYQDLG